MSRQSGTASLEMIKNKVDRLKKMPDYNVGLTQSIERTRNSSHVIRNSEDLRQNNTSEYFKRIDDYDGLFTTQQLTNIDFSEFKNHVFFDSAVDKVYYAYDKVLNQYPYDGTEYDVKQYYNSLDGFTKYVYDNFIPKNKGYMRFDGQNVIFVSDTTGNILNDYSGEKKIGLIDLNKTKFSFEFWIYVNSVNSSQELGTQIVFQKLHASEGITIFLNGYREDAVIAGDKYCNITIFIEKDNEYLTCAGEIPLGKFTNVNFSLITVKSKRFCKFYKDGIREKSSSSGSLSRNTKFSDDFIKKHFFIGNGLSHLSQRDNSLDVNKTSGLIGLIDEFRYFNSSRDEKHINKNIHKNINSQRNLSVYYKFNEPSGEYLNNKIVLDSSGNKVHGIIQNIDGNFYNEADISAYKENIQGVDTPLKYEVLEENPIIFARYSNILQLQEELITKAKEYDKINPNIVYKFFPKSLFVDAAEAEAKSDVYVVNELVTSSLQEKEVIKINVPKSSTTINLLLLWARFFDQLKCYLDQITDIIKLDYDDINNKHASVILPYAVSQLGFEFTEIFPSPVLEKLQNKNLTYNDVFSQNSIRQIQNNLWKRFLINSQDYFRSKGTLSSIKSVFNSFGLETDLFIDIREFNSQNKFNMHESFRQKLENLKCIDFFNSNLVNKDPTYNNLSYPDSGTLLEVSFHDQQNVYLNFENDWSLETYVKFDHLKIQKYKNSQSIFYISKNQDPNILPYINLVFERSKKSKSKGKIVLYVNELDTNQAIATTEINDVNLLSGKIYYICLSKKNKNSDYSEYSINVINSDFGSRNNVIKESKCIVYEEDKNIDLSSANLIIGNKEKYSSNTKNSFSSFNFTTDFEGKLISLRAWKKSLNKKEKNVHKSDVFCIGSDANFEGHINSEIILNISLKEDYSSYKNNIISNKIEILNDLNIDTISELYISPDLHSKDIIKSFDYTVMTQSCNIDYPENYNRVNIVSYDEKDFAEEVNNIEVNPSFDTYGNFSKNDESRLSIDFSTSKLINREISKLILLNDYFNKTLSNSSSLYEESYQDLNNLKNIFYKKLEKEVNIKQMYQIYKYFDNILENLLFEAVPSRVYYQGFNFVYESNILERHKYVYKMSDSRIPVKDSNINFSKYDERYNFENYWNGKETRSNQFINEANITEDQTLERYPFRG